MKISTFFKPSLLLLLLMASCDIADVFSKNSQIIASEEVLNGRFALEGICLNNVFTIEGGNFNNQQVEDWTHPNTGKVYKNAFSLKNPCQFPQKIKEGDSFKFIISDVETPLDCIVCKAYSPTPSKRIFIEIVE